METTDVEDGLRHQQQGYADDEEGGEGAVAFLCDTSYTYQQTDVEEYDYDSSYQSEFLDNNGKDEVGECLAQEVTLYGVARSLAGGNRQRKRKHLQRSAKRCRADSQDAEQRCRI